MMILILMIPVMLRTACVVEQTSVLQRIVRVSSLQLYNAQCLTTNNTPDPTPVVLYVCVRVCVCVQPSRVDSFAYKNYYMFCGKGKAE